MDEFINDCISTGKCVSWHENIQLTQDVILKIEDILHRYNDKKARDKITKLLYK